MILELRSLSQVLFRRRFLAIAVACSVVVVPSGLRGLIFPGRVSSRSAAVATAGVPMPLPPAELVQLESGTKLAASGPPEGWSHLVLETVPRLATGDLDTVSAQGHETARRVHPVILADVKRSEAGGAVAYHLARVGVGLCAPGVEPGSRVVVSSTSVEGTEGAWSTKQRLILAAMALESSKASLPVRTSTFALLRTPVTFVVDDKHETVDTCYAFRVDPRTGALETLIWLDLPGTGDSRPARRPSVQVFDSPMDVKARKILGNIPVSWSFAVRELPPGADAEVPEPLRRRLSDADDDPALAAELEQAFSPLLTPGR